MKNKVEEPSTNIKTFNYGTISKDDKINVSKPSEYAETLNNLSCHQNTNLVNNNLTEDISSSIVIDESTSNFDLFKGLFFMLLSCLCKSLFSVLSKILLLYNPEMNSFQLLIIKAYFMVFISTILIAIFYTYDYKKLLIINKSTISKVLFRTICSILSTSIIIFSLKHISISDVFTVYYTYPGIVLVLSIIFLKERIGKLDVLCLMACLIGVLLVIRPLFIEDVINQMLNNGNYDKLDQGLIFPNLNNNSNLSTLSKGAILSLVLLAASIKATEDLIVRSLGDTIEPILIPLAYSFLAIMLFPIPMFIFNLSVNFVTSFDYVSWLLVIAISVSCFMMMYFMAKALQNESACRVTMVNYLQVVLMFATDFAFFNKKFTVFDILGTSLIFGFNFANGLYKFYSRLNKKDMFKRAT